MDMTMSLYDALVERWNVSEPKDGSTALRAIPAPYDKCLYEILYPDKPWPPIAGR